MFIIEPCCSQRHLLRLRNAIAKGGTAEFEGYGDLSLTELLPALLIRYCEVKMMIVAPTLPDQAAEIIGIWMRRQWARRDGMGKLDAIGHLTLITDLDEDKSPIASTWLKENPFGNRLELINLQQEETAILLPDFVITGPVNMRYGHHFVATATTETEKVEGLWKRWRNLGEKPEALPRTEKPQGEARGTTTRNEPRGTTTRKKAGGTKRQTKG